MRALFTLLGLLACAALAAGQQSDRDEFLRLMSQGARLKAEGKPAAALAALEQARGLAGKAGVTNGSHAELLADIGDLHTKLNQHDRAEPLYRQALDLLGQDQQAAPLFRAHLQHLLGVCLLEQGQYAKAEPLLQACLATREAKLGPDGKDVGISLRNLGLYYQQTRQYARSVAALERSLAIFDKQARDSDDAAEALNVLATTYRSMGLYARAEPLLLRGLKIREGRHGKDHEDVALSADALGVLYDLMGKTAEAEAQYRRALTIFKARLGTDHPRVAWCLNNLASFHATRNQAKQAEDYYQQCIAIQERHFGADSAAVAFTLLNLGDLLANSAPARAEPLFLRALTNREKQFGKDHPDTAEAINRLAAFYVMSKQPAKAEPLFRRGNDIVTRQFGPEHWRLATQSMELAEVLAVQNRWAEASQLIDQASRLVRHHVLRVLPSLSEEEQLAFMENTVRWTLHRSLALGLARKDDPAVKERSAEWLLNHKALAQQALAERTLLGRASHDPAVKELARQLLLAREQLASALYLKPPADAMAEHQRRIGELSARERELSDKLARVGGAGQAAWVELKQLRQTLPADTVYIDIARINAFDYTSGDPASRWQNEEDYVAWIIPPAGKGEVRVIKLGTARTIDHAIEDVQDALSESPRLIGQEGEAKASETLHTSLDALSVWLLQPLEEYIAPYRRWVISPDASLWLVPWSALILDDGKYAVESHRTTLVLSGRELLANRAERATGPALLLANPDYDLARDQVLAQANKLGAAAAAQRAPLLGNVRWGPLPGTAAEAKAVAPRLKTLTGAAPRVVTGADALETVVKLADRPPIVMLSTHGFFLDEIGSGGRGMELADPVVRAAKGRTRNMTTTDPPPRLTGKATAAWDQPLLRCGLVFAGANRRAADPLQAGDDGILTGLEIIGINLRGTDLVVLSACETGLGKVRTGEGVAGLRQGFQLAGAHSVLATLWTIPDRETAELMSAFFDNLAAGQAKDEALQAAQAAMIKQRRAQNKAAHPFYWAAFTLTGQSK